MRKCITRKGDKEFCFTFAFIMKMLFSLSQFLFSLPVARPITRHLSVVITDSAAGRACNGSKPEGDGPIDFPRDYSVFVSRVSEGF